VEHVGCIFRVEEYAKQETSMKQVAHYVGTEVLTALVVKSSTLKMEATCSSETPVDFHRTARYYIPKDRTFEVAQST
jgi:hypothetical protein